MVAEGLTVLASGLAVRVEEGWLPEEAAQDEFTDTARVTICAYPFDQKWRSFWRHAYDRLGETKAREWIRGIARAGSDKLSE